MKNYNQEVILSYKKVNFSFNKQTILKNLNLNIHKKTISLIVGQSGIGKSTLVNLLLNKNYNYSGNIYFQGENIKNFSNLSYEIQSVTQDFTKKIHPFFTVYDYLYETMCLKYRFQQSYKIILHKINIKLLMNNVLREVNLNNNILMQKVMSLSLGQKQRLMIARMIILKPKILILDEVTSAWDIFNTFSFLNKIKSIFRTIIIISHNLEIFKNFCDVIFILHNQHIIEKVNSKDVYTHKDIINYNFKNKYSSTLFYTLVIY